METKAGNMSLAQRTLCSHSRLRRESPKQGKWHRHRPRLRRAAHLKVRLGAVGWSSVNLSTPLRASGAAILSVAARPARLRSADAATELLRGDAEAEKRTPPGRARGTLRLNLGARQLPTRAGFRVAAPGWVQHQLCSFKIYGTASSSPFSISRVVPPVRTTA